MPTRFKWKKLGKVFNPTNYNFFCNSVGYSQAPQTLILNDRVRVYFSTRQLDKINKYLSHIAYVDFNLEMNEILYGLIFMSNKSKEEKLECAFIVCDNETLDIKVVFNFNLFYFKNQ
jgi:hypothetical protein